MTPELLADLERRANSLPQGRWHPVLGSGHCVCTTLVSEDPDGTVFLLADFDPDWFHSDDAGEMIPLENHRAAIDYMEALNPHVVLALVQRIRELET